MTTVKFKTIEKISEKIKEHVEHDHKLPASVTVDNVKYDYATCAYLIAEGVVSQGKDVELLKMGKAPAHTGETVDLKLSTNEYKSLAKNLITFMKPKAHRRLPNFLSCKGKKIKQRVFIYSFAKIIVFYAKNNRLPTSCKFKTSETVAKSTNTSTSSKSKTSKSKSKHGHATKNGCDNMGQNTPYYCACHSLQEVIRNLYGIVIKQKTLAAVMGTTTSGTDHQGIHTAVAWFNRKYKKKLSMSEKYFSDFGAKGLQKLIASDNQDFIVHLAYQGKYGHYEVVNSIGESTWNIQNSLGNKCTPCYCGHKEQRTFSTEKAWINAKTGVKSILVFKRN